MLTICIIILFFALVHYLHNLQEQGSLKLENGEEIMENMDERLERRIDLDIQDYGGTGANKDHDPKSPGNDGN